MDADTFFFIWIALIIAVLLFALSLPGGDEH